MAWCEVCGSWAGFFQRIHDGCVAGVADRTAAADAKKPTLTSAKLAFGNAMPRSPITTRTEQRYRRIHVPQLHPVLMAGLSMAKIQDGGHWLSAKIAARLVSPGALDDGGRDFLKWCGTSDSCINTLDRSWHQLYLWAASAIENSERNAGQMWAGQADSVFTHFELFSHGCRVPAHSQFKRFIASRNDPVWQSIWPPNDWLCGCNVLSIMACDVLPEDAADTPGASRLDPKFLSRALSWYQMSPRDALKVLAPAATARKPKRAK